MLFYLYLHLKKVRNPRAMQPLVVAVDFSNTSLHAIDYSIPLVMKMKSDIMLVWVDKFSTSDSIYPDTSNENRNEAKRRFDELVRKYSPVLGKGMKIDYRLRKGKVYHEVDNLAKSIGAAFMVVGTHGISGFEEFWIGSNAFKIMTYASCTVIAVRLDFPVRKNIARILVPIDSSVETLQKIPHVARIAKLFRSHVIVLSTHYSHLKSIQRIAENYAGQAIRYLVRNKIKPVRDALVSSDITKAVLEYASVKRIDLISIMTEQETPINILLGPHAQQLVNQSPIPVMCIHPQEHFCL